MDFTFNEHQLAFRDAAHRFLMVEAAPELLRETWETRSGRSNRLRKQWAEQGMTALSIPDEFGGMGQGDLEWVLILQELGYFGIADSLADSAYLAPYLLSHLPPDVSLRADWLPRIASGDARIAVGHPVNPYVADVESAGLVLLWHKDEVHALAPDQLNAERLTSVDRSRRLCRIEWQACGASRICNADTGRALWAATVNRGALAVAAQHLGLAQRMLDLGVDYAAQRKQFGRPVGSFQAIKHQMADIAVKLQFAEPVVHRAAHALVTGRAEAPLFVSQARLAAAEAASLAARNGLQAHGAMGYTWEADLQMYMKRAWALDSAWGDRAFHAARVAKKLLDSDNELGPGATFKQPASGHTLAPA